ncbi:MAG: disulfide bond formation protein B [Candidatus Zeuxoniibacter abyssi]|nr:MAG: disulfide bond formation protein B [Candidatus Persebacteraceae bacterium AB1(2)]
MSILRLLNAGGAFLCFSALAVAYFFMERYLLLEPCPLCILDRLTVLAMGVFFSAGFFWKRGQKILWCANTATLSLGFVFAVRHIILQNTPLADDGACLSNSKAAQGLIEIVRHAFGGEGDCGTVYWEFLGLSIPEQVLILFIVLAALLLVQAYYIFLSPPARG